MARDMKKKIEDIFSENIKALEVKSIVICSTWYHGDIIHSRPILTLILFVHCRIYNKKLRKLLENIPTIKTCSLVKLNTPMYGTFLRIY